MLKEKTLKLLNTEEKNFKNLFSICIGNMYNIQNRFIEYIGEYSRWDTDLTKCFLQLDERKYDVEYIGTTSTTDNFWYSAELESVIPDKGAKLIKKARKNLEKFGVKDLASKKVQISGDINGYNLSMIYMAFTNANTAYFCGGSDDAKIYMFVKNLDKQLFRRINSLEFSNRIFEIISTFNVNHKLMVKAILTENDIEYYEEGNNIIAKFNEKSILTVSFDTNNWLEKCSGNLSL